MHPRQIYQLALAATFVIACGEETSAPRENSGENEVKLEARIAAAQKELQRIEQEMEAKRQEVKFLACKADVEDLRAEVNLLRSSCMFELAEQAECRAEVERQKGDSSLMGCTLGIVGAIVSGGTAATWALGGCAAGRISGEISARECPIPECANNPDEPMRTALEKRGWTQLPQCGGRIGVEVETPLIGLIGVLRVVTPGRLTKAGLEAGDRIAYLGEERVKSPERLKELFAIYAGQQVEISFVRGEMMWKGNMTIPENVASLRYNVEKEYRVTHRWGARVKKLMNSGALDDENLIGRDITHVDGVEVASAEHLRELLRGRKSGEEVKLSFRTPISLDEDTLTITLLDRDDQWTL